MTDDDEPITLSVEIDPAEFDEPHQLIYERLVQEFGRDTVVDMVATNLNRELTDRRVNLLTPLGNPDPIQVEHESQAVDTERLTDWSGGVDG
jgi:hypothetical protein